MNGLSPPQLPLHDIHLPDPVGWWPPAPGWWLLLIALGLLSIILLLVWRRIRRPMVKKLALEELATLEQDPALSSEKKAQALSMLLRRVCLSLYPRQEVAGLTDDQWLAFLDRQRADSPDCPTAPRALARAPYRTCSEQELAELIAFSRQWLKHLPPHRLDRRSGG